MDLTETIRRFGDIDADTVRALSKYLRHQSDRLARLASEIEMIERLNGRNTVAFNERISRAPRLRGRRAILERNRAMVQHAARGWTNKQVAEKFDLSEDYVRKIVKAAFGARNGRLTP